MKAIKLAGLFLLLGVLAACGQDQSAESADKSEAKKSVLDALPVTPEGQVYIVSPRDGEEVKNPVHVVFGIKGMTLAPAGTQEPLTGHHHLLIDVETLPAAGQPIPADENHRHFGQAQTETRIMLSPGQHSLQLMLGDGLHVPHDPAVVSEKIQITVVD